MHLIIISFWQGVVFKKWSVIYNPFRCNMTSLYVSLHNVFEIPFNQSDLSFMLSCKIYDLIYRYV